MTSRVRYVFFLNSQVYSLHISIVSNDLSLSDLFLPLKQVPVGFVVTNDNSSLDDDALCKELIDRVRVELGAFAGFKKVAVVKKLPKTRLVC
mmetsp:Transcript_3113/g.4534  ORF Transcript_3113/g.4534 Transcript_3113/m.4534 type:complete len:92 (+) Transcript_3113:1891-2166(+)